MGKWQSSLVLAGRTRPEIFIAWWSHLAFPLEHGTSPEREGDMRDIHLEVDVKGLHLAIYCRTGYEAWQIINTRNCKHIPIDQASS